MPSINKLDKFVIYADDMVVVVVDKSLAEIYDLITIMIKEILSWIRMNQLVLNVNKSYYTLFYAKNKVPKRRILQVLKMDGDMEINFAEENTYLGVKYDSQMTFKPHVRYLVKKLPWMLPAFVRIGCLINGNCRVKLCHALLLSNIRYGIATWGTASMGNIGRIQRFISKAIKCLWRLPYRSSAAGIITCFNIPKVDEMYQYETVKAVHALLNCRNFVAPPLEVCGEEARFKGRFFDPMKIKECRVRTNFGKRRIHYYGAKMWNVLPLILRKVGDVICFRKKMRKYCASKLN